MDLDTLVAAQRRETARVLGLQGVPAEPDVLVNISISQTAWVAGPGISAIGAPHGTLQKKYTSSFGELDSKHGI